MKQLDGAVHHLLMERLGSLCTIERDQLTTSLWRGETTVASVTIKRDALLALGLPYAVVSGHAAAVRIVVPWASLRSKPVVVTIRGLELAVKSHPTDAAAASSAPTEPSAAAAAASTSYFERLAESVLHSLVLDLDGLEVHFERDLVLRLRRCTVQPVSPTAPTNTAQRKGMSIEAMVVGLASRDDSGVALDRGGGLTFESEEALLIDVDEGQQVGNVLGPLSTTALFELAEATHFWLWIPFAAKVRLDARSIAALACLLGPSDSRNCETSSFELLPSMPDVGFEPCRPSLQAAAAGAPEVLTPQVDDPHGTSLGNPLEAPINAIEVVGMGVAAISSVASAMETAATHVQRFLNIDDEIAHVASLPLVKPAAESTIAHTHDDGSNPFSACENADWVIAEAPPAAAGTLAQAGVCLHVTLV